MIHKRVAFVSMLVLLLLAAMGWAACSNDSQKFTVSFEVNGGAAVSEMTANEGDSIVLPETSKEGFTFVGWFDNAELSGNKVASPYTPTANTKLYAKFTDIDEPIRFVLNNDGQSYTVSEVIDKTAKQIIIHENYNNKPITKINYGAFSGCDNLTSITLPFVGEAKNGTENTHFGYIFGASDAYYNASYVPTSLGTVIITGGSIVGDKAFYKCNGLANVTISNSVSSIGENAFSGCSGLESISVSEKNTIYKSDNNCLIKTQTNELVLGCKNSILPDYVTSIGNFAFSDCSGLTSITIPDSVTNIGDAAFSDCSGLASVSIPDSVTNIGISAFSYCRGLKSVTMGSGVTSIGNFAFSYCRALTNVTMGSGAISIGNFAFSDCSGLVSITIPDSVISMGNYAFSGCRGLTSMTIGNSVTSIGDSAFSGCRGIKDIWCEATSKPLDWKNNWNYKCDATVHWGGTWEYVDGKPTVST